MQMNGDDASFLRESRRPNYESGRNIVRLVDLFSGCGGLTLGVAEACRTLNRAIDVRLAVELDPSIRSIYDSNFRSEVTRDRTDVLSRFDNPPGAKLSLLERATIQDVGPVDILVGGPPCQGHSDLNNHSRRCDPRNELYMVMVRAAEVLGANHVIIENVQGVARDHTAVLDRALLHLEKLGYSVDSQLVHLTEIGVPQTRVRHVLLASKNMKPSIRYAITRSRFTKPRSLRWAIGDLVAPTSPGPMDIASKLSPENFKRAEYLLKEDEYQLPNELRPPCHRNHPTHRYTAMYGRLKWSEPAHTITTGFGSPGQGRYLHPSKLRTLTPHEAARIQFFPDWYDFSRAGKRETLSRCIGNAVPSKLSFVLCTHLLRQANAETNAQRLAS